MLTTNMPDVRILLERSLPVKAGMARSLIQHAASRRLRSSSAFSGKRLGLL
jgi:hypothetical protein